MIIYRCEIDLLEATFFSSREIGGLYQTEPLIGNYALTYALGLVSSAYYNNGTIGYQTDLARVNEQGVYVTPATIIGAPRFLLRTFNAQTDGYWSAYGAGVIVGRSEDGWSEKRGQHWYTMETDGRERRHNPTNRPQTGRIRMLAVHNRAVAYVISQVPLTLPRYIRLGKFMSKARIDSTIVDHDEIAASERTVECLLNPADLPDDCQVALFDLVNVPPVPLIRNALLTGRFFRLQDQALLPAGMRFNTGRMP
jgi:CRISPR-associated protein Csc1